MTILPTTFIQKAGDPISYLNISVKGTRLYPLTVFNSDLVNSSYNNKI